MCRIYMSCVVCMYVCMYVCMHANDIFIHEYKLKTTVNNMLPSGMGLLESFVVIMSILVYMGFMAFFIKSIIKAMKEEKNIIDVPDYIMSGTLKEIEMMPRDWWIADPLPNTRVFFHNHEYIIVGCNHPDYNKRVIWKNGSCYVNELYLSS